MCEARGADTTAMNPRIALLGDIGGHLDVFTSSLVKVGVDVERGAVPEDLVVIQVGDLVHKGPRSDECVALADRLLRNNDGRYIQLWGNHDAAYVGGPDVTSRPAVTAISAAAQNTIRSWYDQGLARLAVAIYTKELGAVLVTHGGLTLGLWEEIGSPDNVDAAAGRLNALLVNPLVAFRPGWLMTGVYDRAAGVTCPRTGAELAGPWLERGSMPFSQIHGHEGVWWWPGDKFHDDVPAAVIKEAYVDHVRRWCGVTVGDTRLWSIDWVLGVVAPEDSWDPLVLAGSTR